MSSKKQGKNPFRDPSPEGTNPEGNSRMHRDVSMSSRSDKSHRLHRDLPSKSGKDIKPAIKTLLPSRYEQADHKDHSHVANRSFTGLKEEGKTPNIYLPGESPTGVCRTLSRREEEQKRLREREIPRRNDFDSVQDAIVERKSRSLTKEGIWRPGEKKYLTERTNQKSQSKEDPSTQSVFKTADQSIVPPTKNPTSTSSRNQQSGSDVRSVTELPPRTTEEKVLNASFTTTAPFSGFIKHHRLSAASRFANFPSATPPLPSSRDFHSAIATQEYSRGDISHDSPPNPSGNKRERGADIFVTINLAERGEVASEVPSPRSSSSMKNWWRDCCNLSSGNKIRSRSGRNRRNGRWINWDDQKRRNIIFVITVLIVLGALSVLVYFGLREIIKAARLETEKKKAEAAGR